MARRWNCSMEWALIQPWRSMQEGLLNTGMNSRSNCSEPSIQELLEQNCAEGNRPVLLLPLKKLLPTLREGWHPEGERKSWDRLAESNNVHSFAAGVVCCHCSTTYVVWEIIRHFSDLLLLQDVYELNAGTWCARLQFLSLCLSTLEVLLV